jgi:hypothetical protein
VFNEWVDTSAQSKAVLQESVDKSVGKDKKWVNKNKDE